MFRKLYIKLKFQNEIKLIMKYEQKTLFKMLWIVFMIEVIQIKRGAILFSAFFSDDFNKLKCF